MIFCLQQKFRCGLCEDLFFPAQRPCLAHLKEQHSGISFKCKLCRKIFRRNDNPHQCRATKDDFYQFNQLNGNKGQDAERYMEIFMKKATEDWCVDIEKKKMEEKEKLNILLEELEVSEDDENETDTFESFQKMSWESEVL
ncbi:hypothetical protein DPMN_184310 [Dreissena polymorpha]|uniref:Uncharacterized protein n=1 Tax=Dreissena polymorpha TaxID=45954 RepID=A0A9D4DKL8_DREPO|nr:hypothetical protein DPMN_184310 [Dreissena polymorpha]